MPRRAPDIDADVSLLDRPNSKTIRPNLLEVDWSTHKDQTLTDRGALQQFVHVGRYVKQITDEYGCPINLMMCTVHHPMARLAIADAQNMSDEMRAVIEVVAIKTIQADIAYVHAQVAIEK